MFWYTKDTYNCLLEIAKNAMEITRIQIDNTGSNDSVEWMREEGRMRIEEKRNQIAECSFEPSVDMCFGFNITNECDNTLQKLLFVSFVLTFQRADLTLSVAIRCFSHLSSIA